MSDDVRRESFGDCAPRCKNEVSTDHSVRDGAILVEVRGLAPGPAA